MKILTMAFGPVFGRPFEQSRVDAHTLARFVFVVSLDLFLIDSDHVIAFIPFEHFMVQKTT